MANLLAHALAAMAFCAALNFIVGIPAISWGVFLAGFFAMLIELDLDDLSENHRSPIGHSVSFGVIWIVTFSLVVWIIFPKEMAFRGILSIIAAYFTHLLIDVFTKEGIYVHPRGPKIKSWITRLSMGDTKCWEYWNVFQNIHIDKWKRQNDDPILNASVSLPSLLIIIFFVAIMPLPP
ncbi:MAG: hypothetical protein JSV09_03750 [Thermoplasmata archaeon]|nr:MAG: hypothetical protein JSV09_03750 [Thermoplasmata archaeon]